jgi:hypothetical protein
MSPATITKPDTAAASRLVAALEAAWSAIRARHPQVPDVVLIVAAGSDVRARSLTLGHFAAARWELRQPDGEPDSQQGGQSDGQDPAATASRAEVLVGGEGLRRGAVDVLGALLHEAAHGLAYVRKVQDTSRQGRFHNRSYAHLARELGRDVAQVQGIGWSGTSVPPAHRRRLRRDVEHPRRRADPVAPGPARPSRRPRAPAVVRRLRVPATVASVSAARPCWPPHLVRRLRPGVPARRVVASPAIDT